MAIEQIERRQEYDRERKRQKSGYYNRPHRRYWTDEQLAEQSKKYRTLRDFRENDSSAYQISLKRGLIPSFTWLVRPFAWTYELCKKESLKYAGLGRGAFGKGSHGACEVARRNGWIDDFTWLGTKQNPHTDKLYCVYRYVFRNFNAVYVGLTMDPQRRDYDHRHAPLGKVSAVLKFAKKHNCDIPQMEILADKLTPQRDQWIENDAVKKFKKRGMTVLNKAKTGVGVGSIGWTSKKWTKNKVFEVARQFTRRKHFEMAYSSAYEKARKNGWLDEMTWMPNPKLRVKKEKPQKPPKEKPLSFSHDEISELITDGITWGDFKEKNPIVSKFLKSNNLVRKYFGAKQVIAIGADGISFIFPSSNVAGQRLGMRKEIINKIAGRREGKQTAKLWVFRHFGDIEPFEQMSSFFTMSHNEKIRVGVIAAMKKRMIAA